jgi:hypothetical protein
MLGVNFFRHHHVHFAGDFPEFIIRLRMVLDHSIAKVLPSWLAPFSAASLPSSTSVLPPLAAFGTNAASIPPVFIYSSLANPLPAQSADAVMRVIIRVLFIMLDTPAPAESDGITV